MLPIRQKIKEKKNPQFDRVFSPSILKVSLFSPFENFGFWSELFFFSSATLFSNIFTFEAVFEFWYSFVCIQITVMMNFKNGDDHCVLTCKQYRVRGDITWLEWYLGPARGLGLNKSILIKEEWAPSPWNYSGAFASPFHHGFVTF